MREGLEKIADSEDTIVAVSTPYGRSGIGVVRLSGPASLQIAQCFFDRTDALQPRQTTHGEWRDAEGEAVDDVMVTFFAGPHSYTGEDMLEVSAHGNPLILNRIVQLAQTVGARAAQPGEFTLRAVMQGKLNLLQAEAVRDFIEAQTAQQARVARRQIQGGLSKRIDPIKNALVDLIAHIEASIDFSDDDVEAPDSKLLEGRARDIAVRLDKLQASYSYGRLLLEGGRVVIAGRPNVGKSSIFNALLSMERAIVSDVPGTTRDVLSEAIDLDGVPLRLLDTAGLRETTDQVEQIGVTRTREALAEADLTLVVVDGSVDLQPEDLQILEDTGNANRIVVWNKSDLGMAAGTSTRVGSGAQVRVSARTGEGLGQLLNVMRDHFGALPAEDLGESVLTHARQHDAVLRALNATSAAARALVAEVPHEMVALDLYTGLTALNELTGDTVTDDILGRIFASFCVGK